MANLRGRPFAYLAMLLAVWTSARWMQPMLPESSVARVPQNLPPESETQPSQRHRSTPLPPPHASKLETASIHQTPAFKKFNRLPPALDPEQDGGRPSGLLESPKLVPDNSKPLSTGRDTPPTIALAPMGKAGSHPLLRQQPVNIYAYSFWRLSAGGNTALAPAAQYGGSQSGVILTYSPFGQSQPLPALLVRASGTPNGEEREFALGLRWRPSKRWPISLTAERRFRDKAQDVSAAYLSGGIDAVPVTKQWRLQAFGQAGYVSGPSGGAFYDAQAKLLHPIAQTGAIKFHAGAGAWAGGQRRASRVDVGPTAAAEIDTGPAKLLLQLDWRIRAAGNAHPKDGFAMTVSTGF
jgi:hypothetical protein